MTKQVVVKDSVHEELAKRKLHPREPYGDVVERLIGKHSEEIKIDSPEPQE